MTDPLTFLDGGEFVSLVEKEIRPTPMTRDVLRFIHLNVFELIHHKF